MRLKVSPKTAIQKIDALVQEGAEMVSWYSDTYDEVNEKADAERTEKEEVKEREMEALRNEPDMIDVETSYGFKIPVLNTKKMTQLQRMHLSSFSLYPEPTEAGEKGMKKLQERFEDWRCRTETALTDIFMDFTPVYSFRNSYGEYYSEVMVDSYFKEYLNTFREIQAKTDTLIDFYNMLVTNIRSPLFYLPEQDVICFHDFVCPLTADTNEAALCRFMFERSIGEKVEMLDVYNYMKGEEEDSLNAERRKAISNAYDGVNRKTRIAFGFPILSKDKVTISLTLPANITSNIS